MKIIYAALFFLLSATAEAQIAKGAYMVGADASLNFRKYVAPESDQGFRIAVSFAKFVTPEVAIGMGFFESSTNFEFSETQQSQMYGLNLFAARYRPLTKKVGYLTSGSIGWAYGENEPSEARAQYSSFTSLEGSAGLYAFVFRSFVLEGAFRVVSASYLYQWRDRSPARPGNQYDNSRFETIVRLPFITPLSTFVFSAKWFFNNPPTQ